MKKKVFFRVDGGSWDGLGHIKRCITLAKTIKKKNFFQPIFIVNKYNKISKNILKKNNFFYYEVNGRVNSKNEIKNLTKILSLKKPKILVVDSKLINKKYISTLKKFSKVVIFEDEKKYKANPDLIINYNFWAKKFYSNSKHKLLGLKFNTISKSFFKSNTFNFKSKKILISLGGEDPNNLTLKILSIIYNLVPNLKFVIILGHSHPNKNSIVRFCNKKSIDAQIIKSPEDISKYLHKIRFVISAGGLSAYEFASAGLPQLINVLDTHQIKMAKVIEKNNCGKILSYSDKLNQNSISNKFINFYNDKKHLLILNKYAKKLIKNSGCELIANNILKIR